MKYVCTVQMEDALSSVVAGPSGITGGAGGNMNRHRMTASEDLEDMVRGYLRKSSLRSGRVLENKLNRINTLKA
jgi:hypothetical protein